MKRIKWTTVGRVRLAYGFDCRAILLTLPAESVHCVVTSPPYWGLRDYGTAQWEGGEARCTHVAGPARRDGYARPTAGPKRGGIFEGGTKQFHAICGKCGARRIDAQLGLEATPDEHVAAMVAVFREVRRVLRKDGTLWLNYGDCYASGGGGAAGGYDGGILASEGREDHAGTRRRNRSANIGGLKPKDLVMMPARIALALQADGWWLRSDIIWHKKNPMPESCTDRPTSAHEHVFLLTKSARYFYDAEAVRERAAPPGPTNPRATYNGQMPSERRGEGGLQPNKLVRGSGNYFGGEVRDASTRNMRNVWTIATAPFSEAHFATFPPALVLPCIKAGTSERGCCAKCGAPWVRQVERSSASPMRTGEWKATGQEHRNDIGRKGGFYDASVETTGWSPSCACGAVTVPCIVLDPFGGSGTVGLVADKLQRSAILIDLSADYERMAYKRLRRVKPTRVSRASSTSKGLW